MTWYQENSTDEITAIDRNTNGRIEYVNRRNNNMK